MRTAAETHSSQRVRRAGLAQAALSGIGFGFLGILGKAGFEAGFTAGEQLALRFGVGAAILWIFLVGKIGRRAVLPARDALKCFGLGIFGYAVFSSCYLGALQSLSASLAVLLLYAYPVVVALCAWMLFGQHPGRRKLLCLIPIVGGLALLVSGDVAVRSTTGVLLGLAAAGLYSLYILASSRLLRGINPAVAVCHIQSAAAVALGCIHLTDPSRAAALFEQHWLLIFGTAVFCTVAPMLLFLSSLQKITPAEASMLSTLEPITGVVAAAVVLGERLAPVQVAGAAAVVAALFVMARET